MPEAAIMETIAVQIKVNGKLYSREVEPRMLLVEFLRETCDLTGTHVGCDTSYCGACTVLRNGLAVKSCTMLAVQAEGSEITTVEGLEKDGRLHPIQKAFGEAYGLQCGYCTPGQICSAVAMLAEHEAGWPSYATADVATEPALTHAEIAERMSGNICRCSAYANIVAAIRDVAEGGRT
jgi:xanthine dehydrogenase YagT iron-sulfur-binding subunit